MSKPSTEVSTLLCLSVLVASLAGVRSARATEPLDTDGLARQVQTANAVAPRANPQDMVTVLVDHAKVIRLPVDAATIVVGNPIIADVSVQRNGILIVTGKSYGITNLIALDGGGKMLAESLISVQAPTETVVTVQRGLARESYSCTPTCQPSLRLGDSKDYFGDVGGQATQRNNLATQR